MILECKVVFLFLCFLVTIRGHAQGDIETKLVRFKKAVDEVPTLRNDEVIYYQTFESGVKGLGYYVELEAIKDGKSKQNVLQILAKANEEQLSHENATRLFNFLEEMGLAIIKHREESEIKAFYNDEGLANFMRATNNFKSKDFQKLCREVLLKLLKEENDFNKFNEVLNYYYEIKTLQGYVDELIQLWKEQVIKFPISDIMNFLGLNLISNDYKNVTFEQFWQNSTDEDVLLRALDAFWDQKENIHEIVFKYLISKIPYTDEDLEKMIKNSKLTLFSHKLNAIQLSHLLDKDPNDPSILELVWELQFHITSYNLDKIFGKLPENLLWLINSRSFCLVSDDRFVYTDDNASTPYLRVTEKNAKKPKSAAWDIVMNHDYNHDMDSYFDFFIKSNKSSIADRYIAFSRDSNEVLISSEDSEEIFWKFRFTDLYTRAKIENRGKYIKIEGNHLILDQTPTIWNMVKC